MPLAMPGDCYFNFQIKLMVPGTGIEPAGISPADFHHTASFDASQEAVRALDYAFTLALSCLRYPPSSLYTFPTLIRLRSALPRSFDQGVLRI